MPRLGVPGALSFCFVRDEPSKKIHFWLYLYVRTAVRTFDQGSVKEIVCIALKRKDQKNLTIFYQNLYMARHHKADIHTLVHGLEEQKRSN